MIGLTYLERGEPVTVVAAWKQIPKAERLNLSGLEALKTTSPRNVLIRRADGTSVVRPFRGLRRTEASDFEAATCHPGRPRKARGLCQGCYDHHRHAGTLDRHPRERHPRAEFVAAYTRLRAEGHSARHVAHRLGITFDGLNKAYYRAVRAGDLTPDRRTA